ncbi:far upstream element-binding protein 3-like isoform X2 [Crassostrea virginica]
MVVTCQTVSTPSQVPRGSVAACELTIQGDIPRANQTGGMGGMGGDSGGGQTAVEVMVPGNKVGLVIGKGGETIRQLQIGSGVKMVIIQDDNIPSVHEKPLRISGDAHKCQLAKEMVLGLLAKREMKACSVLLRARRSHIPRLMSAFR